MENLFVPYEIAKQLKDKGFNEPCFATYNKLSNGNIDLLVKKLGINQMSSLVSAPLFQQAVGWFREQHSIEVSIKGWKNEGDGKTIYVYSIKKLPLPSTFKFDWKSENYHEALTKAIEEALKLI